MSGHLIFGVVSLIIAIISFFNYRNLEKEIYNIRTTETSTVAVLKDLSRKIAKELGYSGFYREPVEVKGQICCNNPLTAELSQRPCVYSELLITEDYEETIDEKDEDGHVTPQTSRGSNRIEHNKLQINFTLKDDTGEIQINPKGAKIDAIEVVNRYEPNRSEFYTENRRILGRRYQEWILPLDTKIYVLGEISDSEGQLMVQKPSDGKHPFVISCQSEEELLKSKQKSSLMAKVVGIVALIAGIALMMS